MMRQPPTAPLDARLRRWPDIGTVAWCADEACDGFALHRRPEPGWRRRHVERGRRRRSPSPREPPEVSWVSRRAVEAADNDGDRRPYELLRIARAHRETDHWLRVARRTPRP